MKRAALLFIAVASAVACGAWRARAMSAAPSPSTEASAVARFPPVPSPTRSTKIDEYGDLRWGDEQARLDNFAVELRYDPAAVAYLVCYDGRRSPEGEARRRCARASRYLSMVAGLGAGRVVTLYGGFREYLTVELWSRPRDMRPPTPAPTVDPSEVTRAGEAPKRKRQTRARRSKRARAAVRRPA